MRWVPNPSSVRFQVYGFSSITNMAEKWSKRRQITAMKVGFYSKSTTLNRMRWVPNPSSVRFHVFGYSKMVFWAKTVLIGHNNWVSNFGAVALDCIRTYEQYEPTSGRPGHFSTSPIQETQGLRLLRACLGRCRNTHTHQQTRAFSWVIAWP